MTQANKLDRLKKKFIFKSVGHLGRFGLAERDAYYLISKNSKKCVYVLKIYKLNKKKDYSEFNHEVNMSRLITTGKLHFPAKFIDSWIVENNGFIQLRCLPNAIKWNALSVDKAPRAFRMITQQLKYIHKLKLFHGDLASKNIVVNSNGLASIIDFEDVGKLTSRKEKKDWVSLQYAFSPYTPETLLEIKNSSLLSKKDKKARLDFSKKNEQFIKIIRKYIPKKFIQ